MEGVILGKNCQVDPAVNLGQSPRKDNGSVLEIGDNAIIRSYTVIYRNTKIGHNFQTGHGATIRENNIIGNNVSVGTNAILEANNRLGNNVRIHSACFLENTIIKNNVFVGPGTVFTDDPHPMCPRYEECVGGAVVEDNVSIGANCTILPGVKIGSNSLIGAGSVVAKDVPANSVVAGNPAKKIKDIKDLKCQKGFFNYPYQWRDNQPK